MASMVPSRMRDLSLDPVQMFESLKDEMSRLFNLPPSHWSSSMAGANESVWSPAVDVMDQKNRFLVKVELPGLEKNDIRIAVERNSLVIRGEKKEEIEKSEEGYLRRETFQGRFYRSLPLPDGIDQDKIDASYKKGILEISLPKSGKSGSKDIPIGQAEG